LFPWPDTLHRFLRAKLFIDIFTKSKEPHDVKQAIRELQCHHCDSEEALYKMYDYAMENIEKQEEGIRSLAKRTLAWTFYSKRPLTVREMVDALGNPIEISSIGRKELLESACVGLITVDEYSDKIHLVHYTAQQYLETKLSSWFSDATPHEDMLLACLTYLSLAHKSSFKHGGQDEKSMYNYAAHYWGYYAHTVSLGVKKRLVEFLQHEQNVFGCWKAIASIIPSRQGGPSSRATALHLASYFGLNDIICYLLDHGHDINSVDPYGHTPLSLACLMQWESAVKILLHKGADTNSLNKTGPSSLLEAVRTGNNTVLEMLLNAGAQVDFRDENGRTLISWACELGHEQPLRALLALRPNDAYLPDQNKRTPLSWAAGNNYASIIKLLLHVEDVDPEYQDNACRSPLSWAAEKGCTEVIKILLDSGRVNPDSRDVHGRSPLWWAAENGNAEIVRLLVALDTVHLDSYDNYGQTPLSRAVQQGNVAIVQILQRHGMDRIFRDMKEQEENKASGIQSELQQTFINTSPDVAGNLKIATKGNFSIHSKLTPRRPCKKHVPLESLEEPNDYEVQIMLLQRQKRQRLAMSRIKNGTV
jgi:ankyrin repeat protein